MRLFLRFLIVVVTANVLICCSQRFDDKLLAFCHKPIMIPYEKMAFFNPYSIQDDDQKNVRFVTYLDSTECLSCSFGQLSENERRILEGDHFSIVQIQYIVKVHGGSEEAVRKKMIQSRLQGEIYFDTICAMERANPQINDNVLFHSFILNDKNEVIMVGNPFKNEKMEALFLKILDREKQRKKAV